MKKVLLIMRDVAVNFVIVVAIILMIFTVISVTTFDQNNRSIFGYKAFIVKSDSMSATDFDAGDVVLIKEIEPATIQAGDIIAYISENMHNYGETVTHKVRSLTTTQTGEPGFITYGTTTDTDDEAVVTYDKVVGKYTGRIPAVGTFFMFLKTTPGYITCILIPFLALILYEIIHCIRLFWKHRQEQLGELQSERAKMEEAQRAAEAALQELQMLKGMASEEGSEPVQEQQGKEVGTN